MRAIHNFSDVAQALSDFIPKGSLKTSYTLDTIQNLMHYLGDPQERIQVIHVAGTSGKTSTAYFVAALLTEAGYKTGLTVSPHINQINERTQINLQPLAEQEYCKELAEFLELVDESGLSPSHFEVLVAFSYWIFHKRRVQYAVVEVGLGGLLDGTNVIKRADKVCVITDIGFDHVDVLGDSLAKIAAQKAGIILTGNEVFMHDQSPEVIDVVRSVSASKGATLHILEPQLDSKLSNLPTFQQRNFSLAIGVVESVLQRDGHIPLTGNQISTAAHTYIPGRMEVINYHGKTLVIDGAHNEQKVGALVDAMKQRFPEGEVTMLVSFGQNKHTSVEASLKLLRKLGSSIIITKFTKGQDEARSGIEPSELFQYAKRAGFTSITVENDLSAAVGLLQKVETNIGLIVGSLYLVESVRPIVFGTSLEAS